MLVYTQKLINNSNEIHKAKISSGFHIPVIHYSTSPAIVARLQILLYEAGAKMWKFFGKRFGRSSGASVAKTPSGSLADLRGKFYLDKVS